MCASTVAGRSETGANQYAGSKHPEKGMEDENRILLP